ncbi:MAG: hypothetical protein JWM43_1571 [Acidobacteriaceae bacterium]|nr:hypothetical protein [Acidobacteriaceae bacterium]
MTRVKKCINRHLSIAWDYVIRLAVQQEDRGGAIPGPDEY